MLRATVVFLATLWVVACGDTDTIQTQQWRFALEEVEGSVQDGYAQRFKELIEERTEGQVQVLVYPYGTLGTSAQLSEQVQSGTVQFAFASPGHLGSVVAEVQAVRLQYWLSAATEGSQEVASSRPRL